MVEQNTASKEIPAPDENESEVVGAEGGESAGGKANASGESEDAQGEPSASAESGDSGEDSAVDEGEKASAGTGSAEAGLSAEEDQPGSFPEKSTAAPVDYAMAAQAGPVMQYFASAHLPAGARPLGVPFAGQFATGQVLVKKVQLKQGSCTTIVGVGLPPITELHLQLVDPDAGVELAADATHGPQAVLGSRDDCYRAERDRSAVVIVTAEAGQGVAGVQVFQK